MTTDELKKEAEESFEKYRVTDIDYVVSPYSEDEGEKNLMFNNEYDAEEEYYRLYFNGYIAGAEPREKQIQTDSIHIRELQKQNGELTDNNKLLMKDVLDYAKRAKKAERENKELEAQIEKIINEIDKTMVLSNMRECEICDIQDIFRNYGFKRNSNDIWEIKEK